ncbi:DNA-binding protein inhibitor ID-4 [Acipenser oxyrinchus oxyrinchus]|uniref:DNA-binding protein inhibitor ID-4 n=1 Tax=Acipenser oxyrinchus oxyrinchus TaxID=40147 RepID=A0AAD8LSJ3_ACIOX|nr:DNA-binding protein inhibitor ID-4 [Acipenser oxyrinchus oxyrinchus]
MKAVVSPGCPQKDSSNCSELALRCLSDHSLSIARCKMEEEDSLCLQYDMNDCYSRLKRLVPTIPRDKNVSRVEILQHVIDYILDLQFALEANPVLLSQQHGNCPSANRRAPLSALNTDQVSRVKRSYVPWLVSVPKAKQD